MKKSGLGKLHLIIIHILGGVDKLLSGNFIGAHGGGTRGFVKNITEINFYLQHLWETGDYRKYII